jgi:hypothetical protein
VDASNALDYSISASHRAELLGTILHGSADDIAKKVMDISPIREAINRILLSDLNSSAVNVTNNKSVLFKKSFDELNTFQWNDIVDECVSSQPMLADIILTIMTRQTVTTDNITEDLVPKLGLLYAIMMQERYHKLSLVQRVLAIALKDEQTHEKVCQFHIVKPLPSLYIKATYM